VVVDDGFGVDEKIKMAGKKPEEKSEIRNRVREKICI
jgi:hypothetical protein